MKIEIATLSDIKAIENLLNTAYRGESSKQGWTTEADIISGEIRTDSDELEQIITKKGSVIGRNRLVRLLIFDNFLFCHATIISLSKYTSCIAFSTSTPSFIGR